MSDDSSKPQWVYADKPPRRTGRVWLVVVLAAVAVAAVAAIVLLQLNQGGQAKPTPTASTASATRSTTPSTAPSGSLATATPPAPSPLPSGTSTAPAPQVPDVGPFRDQVAPRLNDAMTGLRMLGSLSGTDATQVVDQLANDAMVLSDQVAPTSLDEDWHASVEAYLTTLQTLRNAYANGTDSAAALSAATDAAQHLRDLVGL